MKHYYISTDDYGGGIDDIDGLLLDFQGFELMADKKEIDELQASTICEICGYNWGADGSKLCPQCKTPKEETSTICNNCKGSKRHPSCSNRNCNCWCREPSQEELFKKNWPRTKKAVDELQISKGNDKPLNESKNSPEKLDEQVERKQSRLPLANTTNTLQINESVTTPLSIKLAKTDELQISNTKSKSEYLTDKWLEWLLDVGFSDIDNLMYQHYCDAVHENDQECMVCTAFIHSEREDK